MLFSASILEAQGISHRFNRLITCYVLLYNIATRRQSKSTKQTKLPFILIRETWQQCSSMHTTTVVSRHFLLIILAMITTVTALYTPTTTRNETPAHLLNPSKPSFNLLPDPKLLSMTFDPFGLSLQSSAVNTALRGAFRETAYNRPDETITNNGFHYHAVGGSVKKKKI